MEIFIGLVMWAIVIIVVFWVAMFILNVVIGLFGLIIAALIFPFVWVYQKVRGDK